MYSTYIMQTQNTNLPTNLPTTKTKLKKKITINMSEASHSFFSPQPQPPERCAFKKVPTSLHRIISRLSTRPDTSQRSTLGHSGSRRRSQNFLEKKSRALFSEALGKVSLDIITRNQGWVLSPGGQYESIASQGCGNEIGVLGGDVRRIESRTWT